MTHLKVSRVDYPYLYLNLGLRVRVRANTITPGNRRRMNTIDMYTLFSNSATQISSSPEISRLVNNKQ